MKKLGDELRKIVNNWTSSCVEKTYELLTFDKAKHTIISYLRSRAEGGHATWSGYLSSEYVGDGCLGSTLSPDEDEILLRRMVNFLQDEGLTAKFTRTDVPEYYNKHRMESENAYSVCYIDVNWE